MAQPLLLSRSEVDALYDCVAAVTRALTSVGVRPFLVAGSLLGAVRSGSILFCDDDVDVGVLEEEYARVPHEDVAAALRSEGAGHFVARPWPGADRVRPARCTHVWVDIFVIRRYESLADLRAVLDIKANGQPQPAGYRDGILDTMARAASSVGGVHEDEVVEEERLTATSEQLVFPIYHYDNRKAIELWPGEFFRERELLPLRRDLLFGPVSTPYAPARPVGHLLRAYGDRVFVEYKVADSHVDWCREIRDRIVASGGSLVPGSLAPMEDEHYLPVQHSLRAMRVDASDTTKYGRAAVEAFIARELHREDEEQCLEEAARAPGAAQGHRMWKRSP